MTLYPDWTPPKYPQWLEKMKRGPVKSVFANRLHYNARKVRQADADGIDQLVPIIIAAEAEPADLRRELGSGVWKKIHHATQATNGKRATIWLHFLGKKPWSEIVEIKPCHLGSVLNSIKRNEQWTSVYYAGTRASSGRFHQTEMLYRDAARMGVQINPKWSLTRLRKEHDAASLKAALRKASSTPWAKPWSTSVDGFKFERLISDQDFAYEGLSQRHCVASYARTAKRGDLVVFRVTGADRATYAFSPQWSELKTFANGAPSKKLKNAAQVCLKKFQAEADA